MEEKLRFVFSYERDGGVDDGSVRAVRDQPGDGVRLASAVPPARARGLLELNRAPARHPNQTAAELEAAVLELHQARMTCGPEKLKRILRDQPGRAISTMGEMVKRTGLVVPAKTRPGWGVHGALGACG